MPVLAYGFWLVFSSFIFGNAANQAQQDEAREEMKYFKETPHKQHITDIKNK